MKTQHLQLRLTPEHQTLIERAAQAEGMTLTGFATQHLVSAATKSLEERQTIRLRQAEAEAFLEQLEAAESGTLPEGVERLKGHFGRVKLPAGERLAP